MINTRLGFVPVWLTFAVLAILLTSVIPGAASKLVSEPIRVGATDPVLIDPITTGGLISDEQIANWEAANRKFNECGLCGEAQPFPGDLPE